MKQSWRYPLVTNITMDKLRWYPQQPQYFIFTNLSEACCEAKRWTPVEPVEPELAHHQNFPKPFPGPSLQPPPEPVEPDLALHQGTRLPGTFSGTFSGTLLNPTWLYTKPSQTFSGTFSGTLLKLAWLRTTDSRNLLRNLLRSDLALHQGFLEPCLEPFPEPC